MVRGDRDRTRPTLILALFSITMVAPLIFAGKVFYFRDFGFFYYPVKRYFVNRILGGGFPLWSPEMSCGTPVHGELVHGFLYPPNALLFLGASPGWGLYFAAHLFLAGFGARRLALCFGARSDAALAAGIAFAGSGYLVSQMNHVPYLSAAAWAPLIVSLVIDLRDRRWTTVAGLAAAFAMAALAGEPFTVLLTVLFAACVVLAGFAGSRIPALLRTGVAGAIALLIASPSLLPALQQVGESVRAGTWEPDPDGFGSLHPVRFLTLLAPEALGRHQHSMELPVPFFGGVIDICPPILLAVHLGALTVLAVLFAPLRTSAAARLLLAVILAAGLLALGPHLGLATWLSTNVPGVGIFRYPDKYWLLATLAAATLTGLAIPRFRPAPTIVAALVCAVAALVLGLATKQPLGAATGAIAFGMVVAAFLVPAAHRTKALTAILAAELLFFGLRHSPVTDPANLSSLNPGGIGAALQERHPGRIFDDYSYPVQAQVEEVTLLRLKNLQSMAGVPDGFSYSIGYDPVEPVARIAEFFKMPGDLPSSDRNGVWHRLMRLSGTTHSITNKEMGADLEVAFALGLQGTDGVRVFSYRGGNPRARLYGDVVFTPDLWSGRDIVHDLSRDPFQELVLEGEGEPESLGRPSGGVRFAEDLAHRVRLEVESDRPAWLLLTDTWAPGWEATVDGKPTPIRVGMVAFRAVRVPPGNSVVEFTYRPPWLRVVPVTAGSGLLLLGLAFWLGRRRRS